MINVVLIFKDKLFKNILRIYKLTKTKIEHKKFYQIILKYL
jgi:hypothetical protein